MKLSFLGLPSLKVGDRLPLLFPPQIGPIWGISWAAASREAAAASWRKKESSEGGGGGRLGRLLSRSCRAIPLGMAGGAASPGPAGAVVAVTPHAVARTAVPLGPA
jgi:hypothetical protein